MQSHLSLIVGAAAVAGLAVSASAQVLISDFQSGTFDTVFVNSGDARITNAAVVSGNDGAGDFAATITAEPAPAPAPQNQFVPVLRFNAANFLAEFHANDSIEFELESVNYTGDFLNTFVVFQANGGVGFVTLNGSAQFSENGATDVAYAYNYELEGDGQGRTILDTIDSDRDGTLDDGFTFFNVFLVQQVGNGETSTVVYDDIRLTVIPEPATAGLIGLAGLGLLRRRRA
jgi:hypothetical protein